MARLLIAPLLIAAACSADATPEARLSPLADCTAAIRYVKRVEIARMNKAVDDAFDAFARGDTCQRYDGWGDGDTTGVGTGSGSGGSVPPPTHGTGTNNQVAGVDEADFVKNDGQYIYLAQNGVFRIITAWPADQTHQVSVTALPGEARKLFVTEDRALVYVATKATHSRECTYGYDCDFTGDGSPTELLIYDITDRTAPRLVRDVGLSGSLIAARRIGNAVHTVVTQATRLFPNLPSAPEHICSYGSGPPPFDVVMRARGEFDIVREVNREVIEHTEIGDLVPTATDSAAAAPGPVCSSLYASAFQDGTAFTSIVSLDIAQPDPLTISTVVSRAGAVYASEDSLYVAVAHTGEHGDVSTVHRFAISEHPGETHYEASGYVAGRALNQFAMDEHDGILRIATTNGRVPSPNVESRLDTLAQDGDQLVTLGSVEHIAPHEDIRAVRFDRDRAFVVTFKKTDPLYAFDLHDPSRPRMLGELQIPGFSTYMQLIDDTHLLTIGYDADDQGSFAWFNSVILQIFDVSDPTAPMLTHKHVIGTRGSSSEALTDHLAFTWYPEESLLALPMTICEGGGNGVYGQTMTFSGLMVFDTTVSTGFAERGRVPHTLPNTVTCDNWWADATSEVKRSLFLDRYVYSISDAQLKVRSIDALDTELVTLSLE